jgi:prepilin-type N-terminal cleavage/methylation domain-containing protein/prepilin-type processing-associated H-X9-DG protein
VVAVKPPTKPSQGKRGFTLIELLVVIAIIAILAAVLFPVFARAREKARQTTCASHQKQFAAAYLAYAQDYDETVPPWTNAKGMVLQDFLLPYTSTKAMYVCPSDDGRSGVRGPVLEKVEYSYWRNSYLDRWSGYLPNDPINLAEIPHPATTVFICDGPSNQGQHTWGLNPSHPLQKQWPDYRFGDDRHGGGGNYAFVDGHVKWLKPDQIKSTRNDADTDTEPKWTSPQHPKLPRNDGQNPWFRP